MTRHSLREALLLLILAGILGFTYTLMTKQGFFSEHKPVKPAAASNLEMISLARAKELFDGKNALFIDSRHEFDYSRGHIHGAVNIALNEYNAHLPRLNSAPKDKVLIVYCDGAECNSSIELAVRLMEAGFSQVKVFFGGWQEWKSADLPMEK